MTKIRLGRTLGGVLLLGGFAAALASLASAQAPDPLAELELEDGKLGWDGVRLGMSLLQVERRVGVTLGLSDRGARPGCSEFATEAERSGLWLVLGFPAAKPGAKLEAIWVRFEGHQVAATAAELSAALRARIPQAVWRADPAHPEVTEADDPTPTYLVPAEAPALVRFTPREGMLIARRDCAD